MCIRYHDESNVARAPLSAQMSNNVFIDAASASSPSADVTEAYEEDLQVRLFLVIHCANTNFSQSPPSNWGYRPLKVRAGALKRPTGYQPELVCVVPWSSPTQAEYVHSIAINSAYGLFVYFKYRCNTRVTMQHGVWHRKWHCDNRYRTAQVHTVVGNARFIRSAKNAHYIA